MFGRNYSKPGKGVNKRDPNQPRTTMFFEILGEKFWDFCKINLLYFVFAIPALIIAMFISGILSNHIISALTPSLAAIFEYAPGSADMISLTATLDLIIRFVCALLFTVFFGAGPITAGFTYALRNHAREEHVWLFSDFLEKSRENFAQALCLWLIDLFVFYIACFAFIFYSSAGGALSYMKYLLIIFVIVYAMMHLYIYQIMITFKLSLKNIFRNAFILALGEAPKTLLLLGISVLIHIVLPYLAITNIESGLILPILLLLEVALLIALTGFITNFFIYPTMEKYIKLANENETPDKKI